MSKKSIGNTITSLLEFFATLLPVHSVGIFYKNNDYVPIGPTSFHYGRCSRNGSLGK